MSKDNISFSIDDPQYDENTYAGRFESMRATQNMILAFCSNSQITEMKELIKRVKAEETAQKAKTGKPHISRTSKEIQAIRDA